MKFVAAASALCVLSVSAFAPQRVSRAAVSKETIAVVKMKPRTTSSYLPRPLMS
jgi:hypothetical protein